MCVYIYILRAYIWALNLYTRQNNKKIPDSGLLKNANGTFSIKSCLNALLAVVGQGLMQKLLVCENLQ